MKLPTPRPSFVIDATEPVAQNFYPVTSMITIRWPFVKNIQLNHPFIYSDDKQQFGVVTDRAQGGTSLEVQPLFKITSMFLCQNRLT